MVRQCAERKRELTLHRTKIEIVVEDLVMPELCTRVCALLKIKTISEQIANEILREACRRNQQVWEESREEMKKIRIRLRIENKGDIGPIVFAQTACVSDIQQAV